MKAFTRLFFCYFQVNYFHFKNAENCHSVSGVMETHICIIYSDGEISTLWDLHQRTISQLARASSRGRCSHLTFLRSLVGINRFDAEIKSKTALSKTAYGGNIDPWHMKSPYICGYTEINTHHNLYTG